MRIHSRSRGISLVELIVAIVIIGVALAGVLTVFIRNTSASADPMIAHQAIAVAEAYLEEALTRNFSDPDGSEAGETRATYDDVDDYHNLANSGCLTTSVACPTLGSCACNQNGDPIAGLAGYTVQMTAAGEALNAITASNAIRVEVTVTPPHGGSVVISGYRTNY